jgi:hypothetical protein
MSGSAISGQADVALATNCSPRCHPIGGSDILVTLNKATPHASYEAMLALDSCEAPTNQRLIAYFIGSDGARAHTSIPVMTLTSGKYVLVVRRRDGLAKSSGCGIIKRAWLW